MKNEDHGSQAGTPVPPGLISEQSSKPTKKKVVRRLDKILDSYDRIKRQELAELRRMPATESVRRGLALIEEIARWKK